MDKEWFEGEINKTSTNTAKQIYNSAHGIIYSKKIQEKLILDTNEKVIWKILCNKDIIKEINSHYPEIQFKPTYL